MSWSFGWRPYVPVAQRRANAATYAAKLAKIERRTLAPIEAAGRVIASSFWGKAWCENLESYTDFENRLPRGRTYVRNGSIIDLQIQPGKVKAFVSGSEIYQVTVTIKTLAAAIWSRIKKDCARSIESLMDLLQGRFHDGMMQRLSRRDGGLFPQPREIKMSCTCPDWAVMCKHVAAALYGVGARLDTEPELLFILRDVDHLELVSQAARAENLDRALSGQAKTTLGDANLGEIFGIDLETRSTVAPLTVAKSAAPKNAVSSKRPRAGKKPPSTSPPTRAASPARKKRRKNARMDELAPRQ